MAGIYITVILKIFLIWQLAMHKTQCCCHGDQALDLPYLSGELSLGVFGCTQVLSQLLIFQSILTTRQTKQENRCETDCIQSIFSV